MVRGAVNAAWAKLGGATGTLGVPTGEQSVKGDTVTQKFNGGEISWNRATKEFSTKPGELAAELKGLDLPDVVGQTPAAFRPGDRRAASPGTGGGWPSSCRCSACSGCWPSGPSAARTADAASREVSYDRTWRGDQARGPLWRCDRGLGIGIPGARGDEFAGDEDAHRHRSHPDSDGGRTRGIHRRRSRRRHQLDSAQRIGSPLGGLGRCALATGPGRGRSSPSPARRRRAGGLGQRVRLRRTHCGAHRGALRVQRTGRRG